MAGTHICYYSKEHYAGEKYQRFLENTSQDGVKWILKYFTDYPIKPSCELYVYLAWKFELESQEKIKGFAGNISARYQQDGKKDIEVTFDVELIKSGEWIEKRIALYEGIKNRGDEIYVKHCFDLIAIREDVEAEEISIMERFGASDMSDVVLVVEGKKFHVNKNFLAFHSDYFRTLFFSNFKEKSMDEIPIVDVKYTDFALLLRTIYPDPEDLTDETADTLLELADRFQMTGLFRQVAKYLMKHSEARLCKMLLLADKHKLKKLYEKCMNLIRTPDHVKAIKRSPYYKGFSDSTKIKLLDLICDM